jgi:hypothetical protein
MRIAFLLFFLFSFLLAAGQDLFVLESEMAAWQRKIGNAEVVRDRLEASEKFEELLRKAFEREGVFHHPFDSLPKVATFKPEDEAFRVFNWNIPLTDGKHAYRLFILFPGGDFIRFDDTGNLTRDDESRELKPREWYGALYYEIHPLKIKRNTYYTLIGWDGNDALTTKKVLDVLVVDKKKARLGYPLFEKDGKLLHRRVFEYAEDVVMNLKWLEPKEMIVFDRLEPRVQGLEGNYAYYGPSTSYDGYSKEKDRWKLHEFVDMTRPKSDEPGARFNFPERPDFKRKRGDENPLIGN